ncbi:MAG: hypothetical protein WBA74_19430 [Cyclobacteriaceae bacterium]
MAKSWTEKYYSGKAHQIKTTEKRFADIAEGEKMLIATPQIIDKYIRNIAKGSSANLMTMRKDLALDYQADKTCPVTTSIYLKIVIEKAYEEYQNGKGLEEITPFWRVINSASPIAKKLSFSYDFVKNLRDEEGLPV